MVVVPALSFIVSIIVAVVSIPPSFGPIVMPPVPLTVNSVDGTADVDDDSLDATTLMFHLLAAAAAAATADCSLLIFWVF